MSYTELLSQVIFSAGVRIFLAEADTTTIAIFLLPNFIDTALIEVPMKLQCKKENSDWYLGY